VSAAPGPGDALLAGLTTVALERISHFIAPFEAAAGEVLFRQGDQSDRMYVIEEGTVEIRSTRASGDFLRLATLGVADIVGETSLLAGSPRTATALVLERTSGWMLHRSGVEMLRSDPGEGAVELMARLTELALARLRSRYEAIASALPGEARAEAQDAVDAGALPPGNEWVTLDYIAGLLCFRNYHDRAQIRAVIGDRYPVELAPETVVIAPDLPTTHLLLVLRGALDVSVRRSHSAQRVRLAGPGRFVGHAGALDGMPSPVVAHTREHAVLLPLPAAWVQATLRDSRPYARQFSAALANDIASALRHAERPMARTTSDAVPKLHA